MHCTSACLFTCELALLIQSAKVLTITTPTWMEAQYPEACNNLLSTPPSTFYAWTHDTDHCAKKTPLGYKTSAGGSIWLILGPIQGSHEVSVAGEDSLKQLIFNCLHKRRFPSHITTSPSQTHYIAPVISDFLFSSLVIYSAHRRNCVSIIVISSCSFSCWLPWADVLLCQSQPLSLNHNLSQIQRLMLIMDIGVGPVFLYHIILSFKKRLEWLIFYVVIIWYKQSLQHSK